LFQIAKRVWNNFQGIKTQIALMKKKKQVKMKTNIRENIVSMLDGKFESVVRLLF